MNHYYKDETLFLRFDSDESGLNFDADAWYLTQNSRSGKYFWVNSNGNEIPLSLELTRIINLYPELRSALDGNPRIS